MREPCKFSRADSARLECGEKKGASERNKSSAAQQASLIGLRDTSASSRQFETPHTFFRTTGGLLRCRLTNPTHSLRHFHRNSAV